MDSPVVMESFTSGEETLRNQLVIYKALNNDLSKKIQQLKIEVNYHVKELNKVQLELIEEKKKSSELRRLFYIANNRCLTFFNDYFDSIQQINEIHDESFEVPGEQNASPSFVEPKKPPTRINHVADTPGANLGRITEEPSLPQTSTPFHTSNVVFSRKMDVLRRSLDTFLSQPDESTIMDPSSNVTVRTHSKITDASNDDYDDENEASTSASINESSESPVKRTVDSLLGEMIDCQVNITKLESENDTEVEKDEGVPTKAEMEESLEEQQETSTKSVEESFEDEVVTKSVKKPWNKLSMIDPDSSSEEEEEVKPSKVKLPVRSKKIVDKENSSENKSQKEPEKLKKAEKRKAGQKEEEAVTGRPMRQKPRLNYQEKLGGKMRRD